MMGLFLIVIVLVGVYLWRNYQGEEAGHGSLPPQRQDSALQLLRERYARGEIDHDEYLRRKEGLS